MQINDIPAGFINLTQHVFGDENFSIDEYDMRRVTVIRDGEEYSIRMWDITQSYVRWTLFKNVGNSGEEIKEGTFHYN